MRAMVIVGALALVGCQTAAEGQKPAQPLPANYRQLVADHVRKSFNDPYSIRDASISAPISGTSMMGATQTVCVRANAKNRMGAYVGLKATAIVFRDGRITTASEEYGPMLCADAQYVPFPEIEAGGRPR